MLPYRAVRTPVQSSATGQVHALLVGIDCYQAVTALAGCVNDINQAGTFLQHRLGPRVRPRILRNEEATRAGFTEAIRSHLGQAGSGDVALLWFSGHGSQQVVAPEYWYIEPTGMSQSLVCHDSRHNGVPDFTDKELSLLLDQIAGRGAHVAVVLDCCHSGSGTRDIEARPRTVPANTIVPPASAHLPEMREVTARRAARAVRTLTVSAHATHVALSACQAHESAVEQVIDGVPRGVFSASLLEALRHLGSGATYRDLLLSARSRIDNLRAAQTPVLYPAHRDGPADQPFFGGVLAAPEAMTARWSRTKWLVDAGRCHGIPAPSPDAPVMMTVADHRPPAADRPLLRVVEVGVATSTVEPVNWGPNPALRYPVVLSRVPLPVARVVVGGTAEDDPSASALVTDAIHASADASAYLRLSPTEESKSGLQLRVAAVRRDGRKVLRILRLDGSPITEDIEGYDDGSARIAVARLVHIARWTQIKELQNPWSALTGAVRLEIVAARPGVATAPRDDPPLPTGGDGAIRLTYQRTENGWKPPEVFVRIRNTTNRRLWCVLVNLTDQYRSHAKLFPGAFVAPNAVAAAAEGLRVPVVLPPSRPVEPGARSLDWCKLFIADREVSATALELPRLGEHAPRGAMAWPLTVTQSLGWHESRRDMSVPGGVGDWTTTIVPVITQVPDED